MYMLSYELIFIEDSFFLIDQSLSLKETTQIQDLPCTEGKKSK